MSLQIGKSTVYKKDNYNKKIGREVSKSRLQTENLELTDVKFSDKKTLIWLKGSCILCFTIHENSERVYLIYAG
jgi:hypothetical protein